LDIQTSPDTVDLKIAMKRNALLPWAAGILLLAGWSTTNTMAAGQAANLTPYPWQAEAFATNATGGFSILSAVLDNAPPMVEILPTVSQNGGYSLSGPPDNWTKCLGLGCSVLKLLELAYGYDFSWTGCRTLITTELPTNRYDFIDNMPKDSMQALQGAIKEKFGLTERIAKIETNVLVLRVRTNNAPGLRPSKPGSSAQNFESSGTEKHIADTDFLNCVNFFENKLQIPIVNRSGLRGKYDMDLKWRRGAEQWSNKQAETDAFKQAVLDQLGLDLVPTRETIDILVIEMPDRAPK
jgi:uncharacterized protein (TIGR03435 family)